MLEQVAQWERSLVLTNSASQLDATSIDFVCTEPPADGAAGEAFSHAGPEVVLESVKLGAGTGTGWADVHAKLRRATVADKRCI